ncbi:MAG: hypothetical protein H0U70_10615 [Tatlockia sp.]|nr:hypothetical protein [Tatlockia sp.]
MIVNNQEDYVGFSNSCIGDALKNALQQAGNPTYFEIIETRGSLIQNNNPQYQIMISAFLNRS